MDKTIRRIKRLAKFEHLQKAWKPKYDDHCIKITNINTQYPLRNYVYIIGGYSYSHEEGFEEPLDNHKDYLWLPRIDQHLKILKKCGYVVNLSGCTSSGKWCVALIKNSYKVLVKKEIFNKSLEKALDKACEWALENKEK